MIVMLYLAPLVFLYLVLMAVRLIRWGKENPITPRQIAFFLCDVFLFVTVLLWGLAERRILPVSELVFIAPSLLYFIARLVIYKLLP